MKKNYAPEVSYMTHAVLDQVWGTYDFGHLVGHYSIINRI